MDMMASIKHRQLAFALPMVASMHQRPSTNSPAQQTQRSFTPIRPRNTPNFEELATVPPRHLNVRLRLRLLQLLHQQRRNQPLNTTEYHTLELSDHRLDPEPLPDPTESLEALETTEHQQLQQESTQAKDHTLKKGVSTEERKLRSERLRALWNDPQWREAMLAKRRSKESAAKKSESMKRLWKDEAHREKMHKARLGREAPNKGVPASAVTRLRMSAARKGMTLSDETRRKMSLAKRKRPDNDSWRRVLSEGRKGKTREYFALKREFKALHKDLKLWSDSFRSKYGRLPDANSFEKFVAPMMVLRIRRYLTLRDTIGQEEIDDVKSDIFSK